MLKLIKGGKVFAPKYLGVKDILICGNKIGYIRDNIEIKDIDIKIINAEGKLVFPGFIDSHVHVLGGGGEGGYKTRTPEIRLTDLTTAGVTTVVGCLGTDGVTRDMKSLIAKARGLEEEGVTSFVYTGSYKIPVKTLMDSIQEDILLIDKIIGVGEVALSDHRSFHPSFEEFSYLVSEARVGGMLSGKAGIVNIHMGDGKLELDYLYRLAKETEIPLSQVVPTHMGRNASLFKQAVKYAKDGGLIDFTTSTAEKFLDEGEIKSSKALRIMLDKGVNISNISFSSDAQGSLPKFDENGKYIGIEIGKSSSLYKEVRDAILEENIEITDAIKVITSNPAQNLKLKYKGKIEEGNDADIVIVNESDLNINTVIAMGKVMIENNEIVVKNTFEW
ncbi:beta-aspartyl-peptidase [Haloimpatiens sp. FM7330]|uniref:beta-aspartyl-peptidase n=1 Tax=Haloimpatiens sp. FM7330 TaxID=3298610 RepID=UPI00362CC4CC